MAVAASALEWLGAGLLAAAAVAFVAAWWRRRPACETSCPADTTCGCAPSMAAQARRLGCTLPDAEMLSRGEAFQAIFRRGLLRREVNVGRAVWSFAWSAELERDVRDLAAAEQGCCSFWRFEIRREGAELHWEASVPPERASALEMLDSFARSTQHS
jgi:hypothetical protein